MALEPEQLTHDGVERPPRTRCLSCAAVNNQVLGPLGDLGIEIVHQHPHRGLLRPPQACDLRAARISDPPPPRKRGRVGARAHARAPVTESADWSTVPVRINSSAPARSGDRYRTDPITGTHSR